MIVFVGVLFIIKLLFIFEVILVFVGILGGICVVVVYICVRVLSGKEKLNIIVFYFFFFLSVVIFLLMMFLYK